MAVFILSLIPPPETMQALDSGDKVGHLLAYFVLMGWFAQIYHTPRQRFYLMIGFLLQGILLEILQDFNPMRQMDWQDVIANSIGILLAWQLTKGRLAHVLAYFEQKCCKGSGSKKPEIENQ
ncbi:VanZ like protein [Beggiatoa sp. PS]|nr:VanZ like protein [Beggiatoa sp. PS]